MPGAWPGRFAVLSNTNALTEFLPDTLCSFLAAHPHVSVDLEERLSDEIVGLIAEGVGDIGIVAGTVDPGRLTTYPFRSDRFVLVVAKAHPLAARSEIAFADMLEHDFVGLDRSSAAQRFFADKAARLGRTLRLRVQLRSFDAVCRLVECGVGVGIVPATTAARAMQAAWRSRRSRSPMPGRCGSWRSACAIWTALAPYARQLVEHMRAH